MSQLYRDQPLPAQTNHDLQAWLVVFNLPTKEIKLHYQYPTHRQVFSTKTMALPPRVYQFLVGVFAAVGSFLYGYDLTIVAEGMNAYRLHRTYSVSLLLTCVCHVSRC